MKCSNNATVGVVGAAWMLGVHVWIFAVPVLSKYIGSPMIDKPQVRLFCVVPVGVQRGRCLGVPRLVPSPF